MTGAVRVLLVDDDALVRAGLTMMLGAFDGIEVAGAVSDGTEVAAAVNSYRPDVVLMDIRMPGMDGLTATESLRARRDPPEVIVLTTVDTDAHVLRASGADPGQAHARAALAKLSPGEREVALLVAQGRTNQEIGTALRMSTATVKAYVSRILTKLEMTNRVQVALLVHDSR